LADKPKVLVLFDVGQPTSLDTDYTEDLKSPDWKTERHVLHALRVLGYPFAVLGVHNDTGLIREMIDRYRPNVIFNMVEQFANSLGNEDRITSFLELQGIPLTGCGSTGITLCKDKAISKKILSYHGLRVPRFAVQEPGRLIKLPTDLNYPLIVKPAREEASQGISLKSVVNTPEELVNRVCFVHEQFEQEALVEEYIDGREIYVSVLGNHRLKCFPAREVTWRKDVPTSARFASYKVKWDQKYRRRWGIRYRHLPVADASLQRRLETICKKIYRLLNLNGYARLDLRAAPNGDLIFLEANPNPMLANDEDFALSAKKSGLDYPKLIGKIIRLAA
jgi:D-alanine-D-alanine ligase